MQLTLALVALLAGLFAGFLINVAATRLAGNRSMLGRATGCTRSPHPLAFWQALPLVGYALQRGRCSTCKQRLSPAYPLTEAVTATLFLMLFLLEGFSVSLLFHAAYVAILMLVLVMDWKHRDIYVSVIAAGCLVALAGSFFLPGASLANSLIGAAVAGGFFLFAYLAARLIFRKIEEPLGSGDVLLAIMMGIMLGFPSIVAALVVGPLIAGGVAIVLLATRRSSLGDFIPYGVSLCIATMLFLLNPGPLSSALHLPALVDVLSQLLQRS